MNNLYVDYEFNNDNMFEQYNYNYDYTTTMLNPATKTFKDICIDMGLDKSYIDISCI